MNCHVTIRCSSKQSPLLAVDLPHVVKCCTYAHRRLSRSVQLIQPRLLLNEWQHRCQNSDAITTQNYSTATRSQVMRLARCKLGFDIIERTIDGSTSRLVTTPQARHVSALQSLARCSPRRAVDHTDALYSHSTGKGCR